MKYRVENTSDVEVILIGLCVLTPGEVREFTPDQVEGFVRTNGVVLLQANVPAGVEATVVTKDGDN